MLGVSYLRADDPTQALQEFLLAAEIEDDDAPLQAGLGQAYFMKKSYADAERHYLKALRLDKGNPKYQNNLAALYMEMERWDDAIDYFEKAAT
ncbi:MAG: tetratricopeptide repeat protein, partial [Desulfuromonadales bacterium]|nr:tetratricopeptide repeat protein [Desulfuromonadales bacterium]NIS41386.1 tetratricopeptide repeat protein [Desulfuromonadales bacterium]